MLCLVCVGGPYWKEKCTKILGKWLGCSKWDDCKHKAPDAICIAKCKGNKVAKKTKALAKQASIEVRVYQWEVFVGWFFKKCIGDSVWLNRLYLTSKITTP